MMKLAIVLIGAILSAVMYRMGGSGRFPRQVRVIGVPLVNCLTLGLLGGWNWLLLLCMGLSCAAISTYWGKKDDDKTFINYWLHGLGIALAFLPYAWATGHWIGFSGRLLILPLAVGFWSVKTSWDVLEESGRGFWIGLTIPLLLI